MEMLKVKLINEKTPLKIKMVAKFPSVVLANLQDKETTPTKEVQVVVADKNYDGLSKVIVNPIPDEYIIPNGELEIIQNGTYDVSSKASAKVNVPMPTGTIDITENGLHNVKDKEFANVNVPEKTLGTKTITSNGTYKASDDGLDGYSEVNVSTSGVDINEYFSDTISYGNYNNGGWEKSILKFRSPLKVEGTNADYMFYKYPFSELPLIDSSNVNSMIATFNGCKSPTISQIDTSNVTNMFGMFNYNSSVINISLLDASNVVRVQQMFGNCTNLINFGGLKDLGKAYDTIQSANYSYYTLDLHYSNKLTHDSLMNVINNLYDIATKGCNPQQLVLGSTNLAKLTEEEISLAQAKGWTLS